MKQTSSCSTYSSLPFKASAIKPKVLRTPELDDFKHLQQHRLIPIAAAENVHSQIDKGLVLQGNRKGKML